MKAKSKIISILMLLILLSIGRASAQITTDISNAVYLNPSYIQELTLKTNCDLNGAWSTEYSYYWLSDPTNSQTKLPPYVKNITYTGVIQESSSISISTPENAFTNNERNKYYLSSSLPGEKLEIMLDLENTNDFITWLPLSLYFDPFVIKNPEEQIKLKLSYANSTLGNIIYIQNTKFNAGCYLNLLIKSPDPGAGGKLTIELDSQDDSTAAISGIFWNNPREESNLKITYNGSNKVSAQSWYQSLKTNSNIVIWSPRSGEDSDKDNLVKVGVGEVTYTTSTGYEFPESLHKKDIYNFKVLKGIAGPKGVNGLEFYLNPDNDLCSRGCSLGLYTTETYKQNIFLYTAEKSKKNKLAIKAETTGDESPEFHNFHIDPNSSVQLRIRLTTNDLQNPPILRGLYILPSKNKNSDNETVTLNIDKEISIKDTGSNIETNQPAKLPSTIIDFPNIPSIKNNDDLNSPQQNDKKDSTDKEPPKTDQNKLQEELEKLKEKAPKEVQKPIKTNQTGSVLFLQ